MREVEVEISHVFPIIPLLTIFGAAGVANLPFRRQAKVTVILVLLLSHAASTLHAFPNYVSYVNELWGGPGDAYRYLADSNVDWGQAQKMVRDYIERIKPASCLLTSASHRPKLDYGIPCMSVSDFEHDIPPLPFTGMMIVSADIVNGVVWQRGNVRSLHLFRGLTPKAKLGGSALRVYEGTFDLSPIIATQHIARIGVDIHDPQMSSRKQN